MTRSVICYTIVLLITASVSIQSLAVGRPRVIVTTDGEIDDQQSFIRFLHYCNEWKTEGLVYSNSVHHSVGHNWAGTEWIESQIDAYEKDYPNLKVHDERYPEPDRLRSVIAVGEIHTVGWPKPEGNGPTAGSDLIISALESDTPGPVYVQCWGGSNTAAQALYDLKHNRGHSEEEAQRIGSKMIIYLVTTQERRDSKKWIKKNYPYVRMLFLSFGFGAYRPWEGPFHETWTKEWKDAHLCPNGALGKKLRSINGWGRLVEGDTPAFLYNVRNGLRGMELPVYGSWGGRFYHYVGSQGDGWDGHKEYWHECEDDGDLYRPLKRWWSHSNWDYAARSAWTATSNYEAANHPPTVGDVGPLTREVAPGSKIALSCSGSSDPDGDELHYKWYQYYTWDDSAWYTDKDPWSVKSRVDISNSTSPSKAAFTVPRETGKHVLINLEVTDNGTPPLTRYAQIDFHIQEDETLPASGANRALGD